MGKRIGRNEPCPCGSGLKHKHCCANRPTDEREPVSSQLRWVALVVFLVAGAFAGLKELTSESTEPKRVWSAAHGHWHVEGEAEAEAEAQPVPVPPPGPAPPGKEWSAEHGHWHDVAEGDPPP